MILAKKNGWLEIVKIIRETRTHIVYKNVDEPGEKSFARKDKTMKFFDDVKEAETWILEEA
jgi:hypothetical protein